MNVDKLLSVGGIAGKGLEFCDAIYSINCVLNQIFVKKAINEKNERKRQKFVESYYLIEKYFTNNYIINILF